MEYSFLIDTPDRFSQANKEAFADLLAEQGINKPPLMDRVDKAKLLMLAKLNGHPVGIVSLHPLFDGALEKAGIGGMEGQECLELGYLYVKPEIMGYSLRGAALGYSLSTMLLQAARQRGVFEGHEQVFATSLNKELHPGYKFLKRLGFCKIGKAYAGSTTGLPIATWAMPVEVPVLAE